MPRLTDERREERRRHILTSAWTCFSGNGFHATSMDDVIAATGMSSSAVYRYFRSKDDLIDAAADEAMTLVRSLFDGLLAQRPTASPAQVVAAMVGRSGTGTPSRSTTSRGSPSSRGGGPAQAGPGGTHPGVLPRRARTTGGTGPAVARGGPGRSGCRSPGVATVLMTLMPGLLVGRHLVAPVSAEHLISGLSSLGTASWTS